MFAFVRLQIEMVIIEVNNRHTSKEFLTAGKVVYKHDPVWICPLDENIDAVFNPQKNNFFQHGKCTRWIIKNEIGQLIGRIAAFINEKKAYLDELPTGGIGFFECINDATVAFKLFDTAKNWLKAQGMQAMDGPINFGENDSYWGLLVEGFTAPSYGMNYHPPYYKAFFENYGFYTLYQQITNHLEVYKSFPERFTQIANWVAKKPGYEFRSLEIKKIGAFAADFMEIYNDAWHDFKGFTPINNKTILETFLKMKVIMDPKLIWFAYINNEPAAFIVILPDANQMIKGLDGKLNLIGKLKFLYRKYKGVNRMRAVVMGTKQKFQKHGLESAIFIKLKEYVYPLNQYYELELSWVGDFNTKMLALHEAMNTKFGKKHLTMRYLFK